MNNKSLIPLIIATVLAGCGGDDGAQLKGNTRGSIEIIGSDFFAGASLMLTELKQTRLPTFGQPALPAHHTQLPKLMKAQSFLFLLDIPMKQALLKVLVHPHLLLSLL